MGCLNLIRRSQSVSSGPLAYSMAALPAASVVLPQGEENVGPFANWVNVKTAYSAVGNGTTDDTTAIQNALNAIVAGGSPTLYFPAGTYLVTSELSIVGSGGLSLIGAGQSSTSIMWGGASGSSTLLVDGSGYNQYKGITFDVSSSVSGGNGLGFANFQLDLTQTTSSGGGRTFNTGSKIEECTFQNARNAITYGRVGIGTSEVTILRCTFNNFRYGSSLYNANCLDLWHWYCTYNGSGPGSLAVGITNYDFELNTGAGGYHAYGCNFLSIGNGVSLQATDQFNLRGNYCLNCDYYLYANFFYTNAAGLRSQGDTVQAINQSYAPNTGGWGQSIFYGNLGPLCITDMTMQSQQALANPPVTAASTPIEISATSDGDIISIGDTFSVTGAFNFNPGPGRLISVDDQVISWASFNITAPTVSTPLPNYGRTVIEVTAGSSEATIQAAINTAAAANNGTIVHLQYGSYTISSGLTCPANSYFQIAGDGWFANTGTVLNYGGSGVALTLNGPSKVTLRDFYVNGSGAGTNILVAGADQAGARVWVHQMEATLASSAGIVVDSLNNALVQFLDTDISQQNSGSGVGLKVIGGSSPTSACQTNLLSGSGGANLVTLNVSGPANVVLRDYFYDNGGGDPSAVFATLSGAANVTIEGCTCYTPDGNPWVACTGFTGKFTAFCNLMESNVTLDVTSTGNVWVAGCNFDAATTYLTSNSGSGTAYYNSNRLDPGGTGSVAITDVGSPSNAFIRTMLAQSRACVPATIGSTGAATTDVRMYRVWTNGGATGLHITT